MDTGVFLAIDVCVIFICSLSMPALMYIPDYAAIGDIIDDDGSGYISALEVNIFLKSEQRCLRKWSKPQWFAL